MDDSHVEAVPAAAELEEARVVLPAPHVRDERDRATRDEAQLSFVKGMTHDELDATLRRVFEEADLDGNGSLDPREFSKALRVADLGLSKKEI